MFGLTTREWALFGLGSAVQGALMGVLFHSMEFLVLNAFCAGLDIYLLLNSGSPE